MKITELKGLGPATAERLESVGIGTAERLEVIGAVGAYQLLQRAYPEWVTLNALWGMQAALMEIDWRELPAEIKDQLLGELAE
jgi:DNA transformation protein